MSECIIFTNLVTYSSTNFLTRVVTGEYNAIANYIPGIIHHSMMYCSRNNSVLSMQACFFATNLQEKFMQSECTSKLDVAKKGTTAPPKYILAKPHSF